MSDPKKPEEKKESGKNVKKQNGKHCIIFQRLFLEYIIKAQQSG